MLKTLVFILMLLILGPGRPASAQALAEGSVQGQATTIYLVRHGEVNPADTRFPLDSTGHRRARELVRVFARVSLTHVFASHTLRSRQAVEPTAISKGLSVVPLPSLGSSVGAEVIHDDSPSRMAIEPLAEILSSLPSGSRALVGVNADNLFAILNKLGVPVATAAEPCSLGRLCVPCLDNTCFPLEFDNLWVLTLSRARSTPDLVWLKYGSP